ncbi:phage tail fiber protein [Mesorhizobium sp. C089B]|uniref:phage tail fiber domain-containing protein n=1 Tax=Mesorhizobium sp. C089B TaxID=2956823 RepID=UPI00336BB2E5
MANSYVFYPSATGSTTDYSVPFEYLSQTFVKATVNGASVPFTFLSTYMIRFTTAPWVPSRFIARPPRLRSTPTSTARSSSTAS